MRFPQEKHLVKAYIIQAFSNLFRVHAFIRRTSEQSYYSPKVPWHTFLLLRNYSEYPRSLAFRLLFKFITQLLSSKFCVTGNISNVINYSASASAQLSLHYVSCKLKNSPRVCPKLLTPKVSCQNYSHSLTLQVEGCEARLSTSD